jgi:hypothetical protein
MSSTRGVTLALCMAFISEETALKATRLTVKNTTHAATRDRERLLQLQKLESHAVIISVDRHHTAEECFPNLHCEIEFGRRSVQSLLKLLRTADGELQRVDAIYADYFRSPGAYLEKAYAVFLKEMLPELIVQEVFGPHTTLVMPNRPALALTSLQEQLFERPAGSCHLSLQPISALDFPLFVATEQLRSHPSLGRLTNKEQILHHDATHPFVRIRLSLPCDPPDSRGRFIPPRASASRANARLVESRTRRVNNFPPRASLSTMCSSGATASGLQQHYLPASDWEAGLRINAAALQTQVLVSNVLDRGRAGLGLFAMRAFAENEIIGHLWGKFVTQEEWDSIKMTGKELPGQWLAGEEDFAEPVQRGVHRCIAVPMLECGAGLLLGSAQCPMAYINQGNTAAETNIVLDFPEHAFSAEDRPPHQYLPLVVRTQHGQGIAEGHELLTTYGWDPKELRKLTMQYVKGLARQSQASAAEETVEDLQSHGQSAPLPALRKRKTGKKRPSCSLTESHQSSNSDGAATVTSPAASTSTPFARFSLWPPSALFTGLDPNCHVQLCVSWRLLADAPALQLEDLQASIRNGGVQHSLSPSHPLRDQTEAYMRRGLQLAIGDEAAASLLLVDMAQLRTKPGDGPMPIHTDLNTMTAAKRALAAGCFSALLFPNECQSTILPRLSADDQDLAITSEDEFRRLCRPRNFFTVRMPAGCLIIFRGDVLHASPKNRTAHDRLAIYGMFSSSPDPAQFEDATFPDGLHFIIDIAEEAV